MLQRIELVCGLLAGAGVLVFPNLVLLFPNPATYTPVGLVVLTFAESVAMVGAAIAAYLHAERGLGAGLVALWVAAVLQFIGVVIGIFSVGVLILPAALLTLTAAILGTLLETRGGHRADSR